MIKALKSRFFETLQRAMRDVECPQCRHRFQPFAGEKIESLAQLSKGCVCPKCGHQFQWSERYQPKPESESSAEDETAPKVLEQPADSKIERRELSENELLYHIPASGSWGGSFCFFAIVWNLVSLSFLIAAIHSLLHGRVHPATMVAVPLSAIGFGIAYAVIRNRFATHLIYFSPETIRVQRALFRKKNFIMETAQVQHVKKVEIYQKNYQPVYAIEIGGANRARIRFGSILSEAEKEWFCFDATRFLRGIGARL
jgi:DNA-directed RNA polymerase subunit RPC12/RpoP